MLRFELADAALAEPARLSAATGFLAHELFHFWIGAPRDLGEGHAWLHEGAAEYASWLATASLWPGEADFDRRVGAALSGCMMHLRSEPLGRASAGSGGQLNYSCGAVAQWIVDVAARLASGGRRDGFDVWARTHARSGREDRYVVADYLASARDLAPESEAPLTSLIEGGGIARWTVLAEWMAAAGADVRSAPPRPFAIQAEVGLAIALSACGEMWGVGTEAAGRLFIDAPPSCAVMGGRSILARVNGIDPMAETDRLFREVRALCAARGTLELLLEAGGQRQERAVPCNVPVLDPLPDIEVRRALPAAN
jgi:hypothetical protein